MSVKRIFNDRHQFLDGNGAPYNGALLFIFLAGTSSRATSYNSSTGSFPNSSPMVTDSAGRLQSECWVTTGLSYKLVLANAGDGDSITNPSNPIWTEDNVTGINDATVAQDEWLTGPTPTYASATSVTLAGDQRTTFHVGRRIKTTNSGGTVYSTITANAFGALTTLTVVNDSGTLDSGLSAVSYGLLSAANPSSPILTDALFAVSGSADLTKKVRLEVDGLTTATTRVITMPDANVALPPMTLLTNSLGADVNLNNTGNYFDGPAVAQGTAGTWFAIGTVTVHDGGSTGGFHAKLWDGTTVFASCSTRSQAANSPTIISLSGYIASPAGNIRISVRDITSTGGFLDFNFSGNSKDCTITAIRIA